MTSTTQLIAFLHDRLREQEDAARAAYEEASDYRIVGSELTETHFIHCKPMAVLADIEAKRQVIQRAEKLAEYVDATREDDTHTYEWALLQILVPLAAPFADHPDYPEEV